MVTYDSPAEDVGPTLSFHLAIAAPRSNWRRSASIGLTAVLAAMLFGGSSGVLKAAPPQSNGSVAPTVASQSNKQPAKPLAQSNALPNPQRSPSPDASTAA